VTPERKGGLLAGRYRLGRRLGAGTFGVVYAADDVEGGRSVAIKHLRALGPSALYRFKHEFRLIADLRHPNLVRPIELFSADAEWYIVMELVAGEDFVSHCRPGSTRNALDTLPGGTVSPHLGLPDRDRLLSALSQLVTSV